MALGLFLAEGRNRPRLPVGAVCLLTSLEFVAQPAATWFLAAPILRLPAAEVHAAVLLAGLPTGTGTSMIAELHRRDAALTSGVVLASTILSMSSVTVHLTWPS